MSILKVDPVGKYRVDNLYQWDKNQILKIYGLTVPKTPEIHFVNKKMAEALVRQADKDTAGVITVSIPNVILQSALPIEVYICAYNEDQFQTLYAMEIPVKGRAKPSDYIYEKEDEVLSFNVLNNRLTESVAEMQTLVNNTVASVNQKYDDTYESLVINCDQTLATLTSRCESYLAELKTKCDSTLQAMTDAFDAKVETVRDEIIGGTAVTLENEIKGLISVISSITIATTDWSDNSYTISSDKIKDGSIVDVYYNQSSKALMTDAEPSYTVSVGKVVISVGSIPTSSIIIDCIKVVNDI